MHSCGGSLAKEVLADLGVRPVVVAFDAAAASGGADEGGAGLHAEEAQLGFGAMGMRLTVRTYAPWGRVERRLPGHHFAL